MVKIVDGCSSGSAKYLAETSALLSGSLVGEDEIVWGREIFQLDIVEMSMNRKRERKNGNFGNFGGIYIIFEGFLKVPYHLSHPHKVPYDPVDHIDPPQT